MMKLNAMLLSLSLLTMPTAVLAHGGEDHRHAETSLLNADNKPQRLPDGRVLLPKMTQYQLEIRTQPVRSSRSPKTFELNGHVVMDPNRGARVQASSSGRLIAPATGLPLLGSQVKKGQLLAWIKPVQSSYEAAQQQAEKAETQANLLQAEATFLRLRQLEGSVPRKEIEGAQAQLAALRARNAALAAVSRGEALRAGVDGLLVSSHVVNGQVVDPASVLFEIVDPKGFLIEALVYEPAMLGQIKSAALQGVTLHYLGGARALRDGALPVLFAPSEAMPLALGQVVKVIAHTREQSQGVILPLSAVVKNASNQSVVWVMEQAQILRAVAVQPMPLDGQRVMVAQLKDGQRVVVQGANLINQIR